MYERGDNLLWWASQSARSTLAGWAANGMKFPFTPSFAYFSRKKNLGCSGTGGVSTVWMLWFSELPPVVDEKDVVGASWGMAEMGDEFWKPLDRCWLLLPLVLVSFWRLKPWRLGHTPSQLLDSSLESISEDAEKSVESYKVTTNLLLSQISSNVYSQWFISYVSRRKERESIVIAWDIAWG